MRIEFTPSFLNQNLGFSLFIIFENSDES